VRATPARNAPQSVGATAANEKQHGSGGHATDTESMQRRQAAIAAAISDRARCQAILNCPEAEGRERLAAHFAYESDITVAGARAALARAGFEPGSAPAIAREEQMLADRILSAGRR
jgi:hypothetical protein